MDRTRRALLLLALAGPGLLHARERDSALQPWSGPPQAPPIDLLHPDGTPFSLTSLRGKVVLVNFWASWCEPCVAEMPSLQRLRDELGTGSFEVLGVNYKEGPARIDTFVRTSGVGFPVVRDTDGAVARAWRATRVPFEFRRGPRRARPLCDGRRGRLDKARTGQHNSFVARTANGTLEASNHASLARAATPSGEPPMKRRTLLKTAPAAGLLAATPWALHAQSATANPQGWRTFEVVTRLEIAPPSGQVAAWIPLPLMQKTDWFESLSNSTTGNAEHTQVFVDPVYGAGLVYARFKAGEAQPMVEVTSRFRTRDRFVAVRSGGSTEAASAQEQALYLKSTDLMPTDGIVRETAQKITKGSRSDVEKARGDL